MIDTLASLLARDRITDLQRAAGCCTAHIEHRRALTSARGRRSKLGRRRARPVASPCCT
jgi:hypothetical protein